MSAMRQAARRTGARARGMAGTERMAGVLVRGAAPCTRTAAVLLASEGREFSAASIDRAAELARELVGDVQVLSIARVHGTSLGLPNPGLMPTKAEWDEQRALAARAVKRLKRQGICADGQVLGTRKPAQRICALADELGAQAIVMGADDDRRWMIGSMMWSQEPQHVRRRAKIVVHLTH